MNKTYMIAFAAGLAAGYFLADKIIANIPQAAKIVDQGASLA